MKSQINDFKTQNLVPKYTKIKIFRGSAPNPAGGAYSAPPDPLAGGEGAGCPSPRTPPPLSALRASSFGPKLSGPSGLADSSPHFLNRGYAYGRMHIDRSIVIGKLLYIW